MDRYQLSENDFVLIKYGIDRSCDWLLGTKSGSITAFKESDRESYDRLFLLDPSEARLATAPADQAKSERITFSSAEEKYEAMQRWAGSGSRSTT